MNNTLALVVDDSKVARLTLGKLLTSQGIEVVEEASAEGAINWLQSTQVLPNIIFMDVMMGGMDGLTATQHIKTLPNLAHIPIVVCTGKETDADKQAALATGAIAILSKPPQADALNTILASLSTTLPSSETVEEPSAPAEKINIESMFDSLRERWMPEWEHKLSSLKNELHQTVKDTLSQMPPPPAPEALLASVSEQLSQSISQQVTGFQQRFTAEMEQKVGPIANQAVEQAVSLSGLDEKIKQLVTTHNAAWLAEQQASKSTEIETSLNEKLNEFADTVLAEQLEAALAERELSQSIMAQTQHQIIASLQSEVRVLKLIAAASGVLAIGAIVLALF